MLGQMKPKAAVTPEDNLGSIFSARRDLLIGVRAVVAPSTFTVEEADLLISLYGARVLGWDDLRKDQQGFVAFKELEHYLVHNPSLLSRRIRRLAATRPALVEVAAVGRDSGLHFNSQQVRITPEGIQRIKPVWERYCRMAAVLLKDLPQHKLEAHYWVNEQIRAAIRKRRQGASDFTMEL